MNDLLSSGIGFDSTDTSLQYSSLFNPFNRADRNAGTENISPSGTSPHSHYPRSTHTSNLIEPTLDRSKHSHPSACPRSRAISTSSHRPLSLPSPNSSSVESWTRSLLIDDTIIHPTMEPTDRTRSPFGHITLPSCPSLPSQSNPLRL